MEMLDEPDLAQQATWENAYRVAISGGNTIGLRTSLLRHAMKDVLPQKSEEFLINSRLTRRDPESEIAISHYLDDGMLALLSCMGRVGSSSSSLQDLPTETALSLSLGEALARRRSIRTYSGDPVSLEYLSTVLRAANGVSCDAEVPLRQGGCVQLHFRTAPSAGGLYPLDVFIASIHVTGLVKGVYRYHPQTHTLSLYAGEEVVSQIFSSCAVPEEQISLSRAGAIVFLVGTPGKTLRKYGDRGMRFLFLEAGAIAQNLHLASTSLGLGSVDCASFYDDDLHLALKIDGIHQALIHAVVIGVPGI